MPKTGSSALQAFFTLNHKRLKAKGFLYPNPNGFTQPFQTSSGNAVFLQSLISGNKYDEIKEYLLENTEKDKDTIFSYEGLYYEFKHNQEAFLKAFEGFDIRIICYVRRLDSFIQSEFNQGVKNHFFSNFEIIERMIDHSGYSKCFIDSQKFIDPSKIIIRPYEKSQFYQGTIFSDFLNCIGLGWDNSYILPNKHVNPSLCEEALIFRMFLNEICIDRNIDVEKRAWNKYLQEYSISRSFGKPFQDHSILSLDKRMDILKKNEEGDKQIARIFLNRSDGLLFNEPVLKTNEKGIHSFELNNEQIADIITFIVEKDKRIIHRLFNYLLVDRDYGEAVKRKIALYLNVITEILGKQPAPAFEEEKKTLLKLVTNISWIKRYLERYSVTRNINSSNFNKSVVRLSNSISRVEFGKDRTVKIYAHGSDPFFILETVQSNLLKEIRLVFKIEPPKATFMQVFYQTFKEPWDSETKSILYPLENGLNNVEIVINQHFINGSLRIDPGTTAGDYIIYPIQITYISELNFNNLVSSVLYSVKKTVYNKIIRKISVSYFKIF